VLVDRNTIAAASWCLEPKPSMASKVMGSISTSSLHVPTVCTTPTLESTGKDEGMPLLFPDTNESGEFYSQKLKPSPSSSSSSASVKRVKPMDPKDHNALIKYGSLLLLVGQMVGLVLVMRFSRTHNSNGEMYLASTAVFMMEVSNFHVLL
jgi:hypothetical protein